MEKRTALLDWLILAGLIVAWGSSFAMTKIAVAHLSAAWIMALRLAIAACVLVPYAMLRGHNFNLPKETWARYSWLGLIGHAAPFFLISWGTNFVPSGVSGLLMGTIPLFLVVLAHFFLANERLTVPKALGFVLGFAGIFVLIGPKAILNLSMSGEALAGELAILLGCLCYSIHGVTAKRFGFSNPILQTAAVCAAAAAMGLIFAGLTDPLDPRGIPSVALWSVAGLGLLPTAFASLLMYVLIQRAGPSFVAYSNYLVPVYALLFGALLMREPLSVNIAFALALILSGIAISRWSGFRLPPLK